MNRFVSRFPIRLLPALALVASCGLAACESHEGPAEKAGAKVDNTVNPGPMQRAGHTVDKALGN